MVRFPCKWNLGQFHFIVIRSNTATIKIPTDIHDKCSKVLRSLRFEWIQDPEVVLNECLKTVGLESEYLETYFELFEVFRSKLYRGLERKYRQLLNLVVPAHFRWQTTVMWLLIKSRPINDFTYEQVRRAIATPQFNKDE